MGNVSVNTSRYTPTREPVFTDTMQIWIVVRDLDAALRTYVDDYGIGPWEIHEFNPANATDLRESGRPVERSWRMVGHVMWELIEPLDDESVFARFLAEKGEGVHHIAVATPSFDDMVAAQAKRGHDPLLSGTPVVEEKRGRERVERLQKSLGHFSARTGLWNDRCTCGRGEQVRVQQRQER